MLRVRCCDNGRTAFAESLRGQEYIDIESRGICRRSACSSGLSPQFCCKAEGIIGQWDVPVGVAFTKASRRAIPMALFALRSSRLIS